jgi:hypothetical protein
MVAVTLPEGICYVLAVISVCVGWYFNRGMHLGAQERQVRWNARPR